MPPRPRAIVLGRFPPPTDGQTLATEQCATFLEDAFDVRRLDTEPPGPVALTAHPRVDLRRATHFWALRRHLADVLGSTPTAPVLWHAISPAPLGHARDMLATVPAFASGQPVAGVLHRATFDVLFRNALTRLTARRLIRRLDALVFQSDALAERCAAFVPKHKRVIIPNTVREEVLPTAAEVAAKRHRGPGSPVRVLFLSNHLPEKGHEDVMEAVGVLAGRGLDVRATFAGGWPSADAEAAFAHRAAALGINVAILGPITDPAEVRRLHLAADVFALPTTHPTETQPIAMLEALAAGTPVVATDRDVVADLVGPAGLLVPPHAPGALADAIMALAEPDRWRTTSAAARARFDARFAPEIVGDAWRTLTKRLSPA